MNKLHVDIFRKASKTYFYSSLFFPKKIRDDIFVLYGFARTADNLVDTMPQQKLKFKSFVKKFRKAYLGSKEPDIIISSFVEMIKRNDIQISWVNSFLTAMESDLTKTKYSSVRELEKYIYGSASVIGLMITKILNLPKESYPAAKMLGRSMQFSNFIRDIQEDNELGRCYFPQNELKKYNLDSLHYNEVSLKKEDFKSFINFQIKRYLLWQEEAESGFKYLPRKYRIAIKTASDMYKQTQIIIQKDPEIIFRKKVKPTAYKVLLTGVKNTFH